MVSRTLCFEHTIFVITLGARVVFLLKNNEPSDNNAFDSDVGLTEYTSSASCSLLRNLDGLDKVLLPNTSARNFSARETKIYYSRELLGA